MIKRANEDHPTFKKFIKLMEYADELGLTLTFPITNCEPAVLVNKDLPEERWEIVDSENFGETIYNFPPTFDFKMIRKVDE